MHRVLHSTVLALFFHLFVLHKLLVSTIMKQAFLCGKSVSHRDEVLCPWVIHSIRSLSLAPVNLVIAIIIAAFTSLLSMHWESQRQKIVEPIPEVLNYVLPPFH